MLTSWPVTLITGTLLGFLTGLGIGGGSLLILWLTMVLGTDQAAARGINLMFFFPSALVTGFFRWKQGRIDLKKVLPAMLTGCVSAVIFSRLGNHMNLELLKKLFGGLLIITGLRELLCKPKP